MLLVSFIVCIVVSCVVLFISFSFFFFLLFFTSQAVMDRDKAIHKREVDMLNAVIVKKDRMLEAQKKASKL